MDSGKSSIQKYTEELNHLIQLGSPSKMVKQESAPRKPPKKPLNPYMLYLLHQKDTVKCNRYSDTIKQVSKQWNLLQDKSKWQELHELEKIRY
jgi:hypothetical protein